eukprot:scaffold192362_cov21-Tisochrysis_lutea.AAC.1
MEERQHRNQHCHVDSPVQTLLTKLAVRLFTLRIPEGPRHDLQPAGAAADKLPQLHLLPSGML